MVEEEGTDNFSNNNNASGMIEAMKRADDAIGVAQGFLKNRPDTLILTAADSNASGPAIVAGTIKAMPVDRPLPLIDRNGAPMDGIDGAGTRPFVSAPDARGVRLPFAIAWSTVNDGSGGVVARADGLNSDRVKGNFDNTEVYRVMYLTLFGQWLD